MTTARAKPGDRTAHLTPDERVTKGKEARRAIPRGTHAAWEPPTDRRDPVDILEEQATTRIAELVPIRYGRMLTSPFAFYRGAAAIMAADLASSPTTGLRVQACGDAHISNFGLFASPERALVFDINDFDETLPGPWEWDVKRLAASIVIAGRDNGFSDKQQRQCVLDTVAAYRVSMAEFATRGNMDVWYARGQVQEGLPRLREALSKKKDIQAAETLVTKARTHDSMQAFDKLTTVVNGQRKIVSDPPLIVPIEELVAPGIAERVAEGFHGLIKTYRRSLLGDRRHLLEDFRFAHMAQKVVGVGSVGTRAWILLFFGRDDDDPLFLQAKEAQASVLSPFVGRSGYANQGQRVVEGQRLMQAASDIFLGWDRLVGVDGIARDFYVRQLRDWKASWAPETMTPEVMTLVGGMCGWTLARAHARSGDRVALAAYLGQGAQFDRAIAEFAVAYAEQNDRDHAALRAAAKAGRITVEAGV
jgi:uncharacterized protein (DUF2252 family)